MTNLALVLPISPLERVHALCDPGSPELIRGEVLSRRMGERRSAGNGVIGATGCVDGRPVACYAQDPSSVGGSLGEVHAETICRVLRTAGRARIPVVGFIESAGARLQEWRSHARRLRADLQRERRALWPGSADLGDLWCVGGRRLVLPGADGLRRDDQAGIHVPQAVGLVHRRAIADADDPDEARERLASQYERDYLTATAAAREGIIDEIVSPCATRQRIASALHMLASSDRPRSPNRNIPL